MAGRPKTPVYQYDANGKYLQTFESRNAVFDKYYDGKKGNLFPNGIYKLLPDGTYATKERLGREGLRKAKKIMEDPFCDVKPFKPVGMYNLKNEKIAVFSSVYIASLVTGINYSTIHNGLNYAYHGADGILFKEELELKL